MKIMEKEILDKYIKGSATNAERKMVLEWVISSPENRTMLEQRKAEWVFDNLPSTPPPDFAVKKMKHNLRGENRNLSIVVKIAAILAIPLMVIALYQTVRIGEMRDGIVSQSTVNSVLHNDSLVYTVHTGVKGLVDLPDGSKVWLNSGSTIKCPVRFDDGKRDVELEGEGYFVVQGDPNWPMLVRTNRNITIKVIGTEFNLSSYANDTELKLTLVRGDVTILDGNDNSEIHVKPMERIVIPDRATVRKYVQLADIHNNTGWKEGFLLFDNTPMDQVVKMMERWYGVRFIIADSSILNNNFTAEFKSESLSQVLDFIKKSSFIGYNIDEATVTLYKL